MLVRKANTRVKAREEALQKLDLAYHKCREVEINLKEGLQFYESFAKVRVLLRVLLSA